MKQSQWLEMATILILSFFNFIETFIVHSHAAFFDSGTKQIGMKHFVSLC